MRSTPFDLFSVRFDKKLKLRFQNDKVVSIGTFSAKIGSFPHTGVSSVCTSQPIICHHYLCLTSGALRNGRNLPIAGAHTFQTETINYDVCIHGSYG